MGKILEGQEIIRWLANKPAEFESVCVLMTPEIAESLLVRNTKNRPEIRGKIAIYGEEMTLKRFPATSSGLGFDVDGILQNGQNRLRACCMSRAHFQTVLVKGLAIESFVYEDTQVKRSLADVLAIMGEPHYRVLAGAMSWAFRYENQVKRVMATRSNKTETGIGKGLASKKIIGSNAQLLEVLDRHPGLRDTAAKYNNVTGALLTSSLMAALDYFGSQINEDITNEFFQKLVNGVGITEDEPVGVLARHLQKAAVARDKMSHEVRCKYTLKALKLALNGATLERFNFREDEEYPILEKTTKWSKSPKAETTLPNGRITETVPVRR